MVSNPAITEVAFDHASAEAAVPGATVTQNLTFQFPTRITGAVFRDVNNDSTKAATEGLVSGDTIGVQLRDATGQRVIATASVRCGLTSSGATQTCLNATYAFSSLQGGTYKITVDRLTTKFAGAAPPAGFVPDTLTIVLPRAPGV